MPEALKIKLSVKQYAIPTFAPIDADGEPALLDGDPTFTVTQGVAEIRKLASGKTAIIPGDSPGLITVVVDGDAQAGDAVEIIEQTIELEVTAANAVSLGLGFTLGAKKDLPPVE